MNGDTGGVSSAVTSTTLVVTVSTCLAFRRGAVAIWIVQSCVGREASDATLPTVTAGPDRCDRDSLLQKTCAAFKGNAFGAYNDLTLSKAKRKSKSIKVLGLNNVLPNQVLGISGRRNRGKNKFYLPLTQLAVAGRPAG